MKKTLIFLLILLLLTAFSGCKSDNTVTPVPEKIKIGVVFPESGQDKKFGAFIGNGFTLAVDEINKAGGIKGTEIELVVKDDFSSSEIAAEVTRELIEKDKVLAVIGSYSSDSTLTMSKVCEELETPHICVSGAVDEITSRGNEWVFRMAAPSSSFPETIIDFLMEKCPPKTMAVLYADSLFSTTTEKYLKDYANKKGIKIKKEEIYKKGMVNFKPLLENIKKEKPDLLFSIAYTEDAPLIMKQSKEIDLNFKIFAGAALGFSEPNFITTAGKNAEYLITVTQWDKKAKYPGSDEFLKNYNEKFKNLPSYHSALAYTGLIILAEAIKNAPSKDREDIRKTLKNINMETILGNVSFDDYEEYTNQNKHKMIVLQIQNGEFIPVYPPDVSVGDAILPVPPWSER